MSSRSQRIFGDLRIKTGLTPNLLARFAICMSLKEKSIPNPDEYNEDGSELAPNVLFGEYEQIYLALMINRLNQDKLDPEIYLNKMMRSHLNRGTVALGPRINDLSDFYELVKEERNV
jgi:DNA sulfur modification protein DndE